jgi:hypothetical protein
MKKIKFWILIALYFLLMLADGSLTYLNTPDLSWEGNPLVAKLGLGWGALAIANIVVFALFFVTAYYSFFKYQTVFTKETKFTAYYSQIMFDRPDWFWKGAFLLPKHWGPMIAASGFALLHAGIVGRTILVLEWLTITFDAGHLTWVSNYFYFRHTWCFGRVDVVASVIIAVAAVFYWFYREFRKQLNVDCTSAT